MTKKHGEYLANDPDYVPDPEIEEFMEQEISRAPKDPELLAHRLRNNTAASPRDAGGDLDADWEDVNESGSETVAGDNPTPDQEHNRDRSPNTRRASLPCESPYPALMVETIANTVKIKK